MHQQCDLLIFTWFYPNMPGFFPFLHRVKTLLNAHDTLVVSNYNLARIKLEVPEERFIYLPGESTSTLKKLRYFLSVLRMIKKLRPEKVVFLSSFFAPLAAFQNKSTALFWDEHPLHQYPLDVPGLLKRTKNALMLWLSYKGAQKVSVVMPVGEIQAENLHKHGCTEKNLRLIYLGVNKEFIKANSKISKTQEYGKRVLEIIYTGSVNAYRGRDVMLGALMLANSGEEKIRLTLVGAAEDELKLCQQKAEELEVQDSLKIIGRISGKEIPSFLHKADAGICIWQNTPYYRINPPTKLFEYFVAGLPILASNIQSHTLYIQDGVNGIIFDYDAESLADAFVNLWESQEKIYLMRENALKNSEKYLWENIEPVFLDVINEL